MIHAYAGIENDITLVEVPVARGVGSELHMQPGSMIFGFNEETDSAE
jgi:hypothetical protein